MHQQKNHFTALSAFIIFFTTFLQLAHAANLTQLLKEAEHIANPSKLLIEAKEINILDLTYFDGKGNQLAAENEYYGSGGIVTHCTTKKIGADRVALMPQFISVIGYGDRSSSIDGFRSVLYDTDTKKVVLENLCQLGVDGKNYKIECKQPSIRQFRDGMLLIYQNTRFYKDGSSWKREQLKTLKYKGNQPPSAYPNYTYIYAPDTGQTLLLEGMLVGIEDVDGDGKSEIITYDYQVDKKSDRPFAIGKWQPTLTAYAVAHKSGNIIADILASNKTKHVIEKVTDGIPITQKMSGRALGVRHGVAGVTSSFVYDEQMAQIFLMIKEKDYKQVEYERKEHDKLYSTKHFFPYQNLATDPLVAIPYPRSIPVKAVGRNRLDYFYMKSNFDSMFFPKNSLLKYDKNFNSHKESAMERLFKTIHMDDREEMIMENLSPFSCSSLPVQSNYYCSSTDGFEKGSYRFKSGTKLHFGFTPGRIDFMEIEYDNEPYTIGINKKKLILFSNWLGTEEFRRTEHGIKHANLDHSTLVHEAVFSIKDVIPYELTSITKYHDLLFTVDDKNMLRLFKLSLKRGGNDQGKTENW